jgi:DNA-binding transcriptional LysR family regulator
MKSPDIRRYLRHGTLPQLQALEAVVRLGSVTRAAEALHLAQPTVSGHLRKLSQVAGLPLCEPGERGMVATEAGQALLAAAHDVFEALRRADATLAPLRGARAGQPA